MYSPVNSLNTKDTLDTLNTLDTLDTLNTLDTLHGDWTCTNGDARYSELWP